MKTDVLWTEKKTLLWAILLIGSYLYISIPDFCIHIGILHFIQISLTSANTRPKYR